MTDWSLLSQNGPRPTSSGSAWPIERVLAVLLMIMSPICFATNPSQDDYVSWLKQQAIASVHGGLGSALVSLFGGTVIELSTRRQDFLLFSIYETDLGDGVKHRFIGILRHFFPFESFNLGPPPHVVPANASGHWVPEDGYVWINNPPIPGDLRVRWEPGRTSSTHPHTLSAPAEGRWLPEDGYAWNNDPPAPGDFRLHWVPGRVSAKHPHVVTANAPDQWLPEDGYQWVSNPPKPGDFRVRWNPGHLSERHAHVVSTGTEGHWTPEEGYAWIIDPPTPGDFRVRLINQNAVSANSQGTDVWVKICTDERGHACTYDEAIAFKARKASPPILHGKVLRQCTDADHFLPETPCWFVGNGARYIADKSGNRRENIFPNWPNIDDGSN